MRRSREQIIQELEEAPEGTDLLFTGKSSRIERKLPGDQWATNGQGVSWGSEAFGDWIHKAGVGYVLY